MPKAIRKSKEALSKEDVIDILNTCSDIRLRYTFATSNNTQKIVCCKPYTYEQFYQITVQLLTQQHKVKEEIDKAAAEAVWNNNKMKSATIRDCVKIGRCQNLYKMSTLLWTVFQ